MMRIIGYNRIAGGANNFIRTLGDSYMIGNQTGVIKAINKGVDPTTREPMIEVIYETGEGENAEWLIHTFPNKDIEFYYAEDRGIIEEPAE
jgi:hypothetical protein